MPGTVIRLISLFSTINISKGHDIQSSEEGTLGQVNSNQSGGNRRHVGPQQSPQRPQQRHPHGRPHGRQHRPNGQHQGEQRRTRQQGHPQGNTRPRRRRTSQAARIQANRRVPAHLHQHAQYTTTPVNNHHPSAEQPPSYSQAMGGLSLWDLLRSECANVNNGECRFDPFNLAGIFPLQNVPGFQDQQSRAQTLQEGQCGNGEAGRQGPGRQGREHGDGGEPMVQPRRVQDRLGPRHQDRQQAHGPDREPGTGDGTAGADAQRPGQVRQGVASPRHRTPSRQRRRQRRARLRAATSTSSASSPPPRTPRAQSPQPDSVDPRGSQNTVFELDESLLRDLETLFPERGGGGTDVETPEERERGILTLRPEADGAAESRARRDEEWH